MKKGDLNFRSEDVIKLQAKFTIPHEKLNVINECNGLICLKSGGKWTPLTVYNPLTGQEVIVEQVPEPGYNVWVYGLGFCPVSSQFKIVRILENKDYLYLEPEYRTETQIFTIGGTTNEWRTVGDAPTGCLCSGTAFLHGSLHNYSSSDNCLWSFQFQNEKFLRVPIPECMNQKLGHFGGFVSVNVFDSCLSLSYKSKGSFRYDFWVMKEYGNKDSWVKLLVFDGKLMPVKPLFQINEKKMLVSSARGYALLGILDVESGKRKGLKVVGVHRFNRVMVCNLKFSKL